MNRVCKAFVLPFSIALDSLGINGSTNLTKLTLKFKVMASCFLVKPDSSCQETNSQVKKLPFWKSNWL